MTEYTATYSPEDNKLRLYASARLDSETYARVKAAGFRWAPKQELFVAPAWRPSREDLLIELCGEIGDEDTSLVDRAEDRAERFADYSQKRADDAKQARKAVSAITDGIPLGQPILVGHHSEKHARKDAERIENGMRKAVKMWETSQYWKERAAGAIHAAKYKERPDVRARRIKGIEADKRKQERNKKEAETFIELWEKVVDNGQSKQAALKIANYDHLYRCFPLDKYPRPESSSQYEGEMSLWGALNDDIITAEQAKEIAIPAHERAIKSADRWLSHYENRLIYERAMLGEVGGIEADKTKPEKGGACRCWASHHGGWSYIVKVNKVSVSVYDNWGNGGDNFTRTIPFDKLKALMTAQEVKEASETGRLVEFPDKTGFAIVTEVANKKVEAPQHEQTTEYDAMKETLKAGIKTISAPQLFPTPTDIVKKMIQFADLESGLCVLEPSAGTGNIVKAILDKVDTEVLAYEINGELCTQLRNKFPSHKCQVREKDFLEVEDFKGCYPRIIMNPPFENGSDIKHIKHALAFLAPGGTLVALCANGPRQRAAFRGMAAYWEDLPAGSFKNQGTGVNVAMMVVTA